MVRRDERRKRCDFLQCRVLVEPRELQRPQERRQAVRAEPVWVLKHRSVACRKDGRGTRGALERLALDEGDVAQVLQEREGRLGDDVQDAHAGLAAPASRCVRARRGKGEGGRGVVAHLEVLDKAREEGRKVLGAADVARHGLLQQVLREHCLKSRVGPVS